MTTYGKASPKSKISDQLRKQLDELTRYNDALAKSIQNQEPPDWFVPAEFTGSLFDIADMHEPFSRQKQEEEFRDAVTDPNNPGTLGDLHMIQLQGDYLAALERAYRARHHTSVRTRIQPSGRCQGHGHANGVIQQGVLGHIVSIDQRNKKEPNL